MSGPKDVAFFELSCTRMLVHLCHSRVFLHAHVYVLCPSSFIVSRTVCLLFLSRSPWCSLYLRLQYLLGPQLRLFFWDTKCHELQWAAPNLVDIASPWVSIWWRPYDLLLILRILCESLIHAQSTVKRGLLKSRHGNTSKSYIAARWSWKPYWNRAFVILSTVSPNLHVSQIWVKYANKDAPHALSYRYSEYWPGRSPEAMQNSHWHFCRQQQEVVDRCRHEQHLQLRHTWNNSLSIYSISIKILHWTCQVSNFIPIRAHRPPDAEHPSIIRNLK